MLYGACGSGTDMGLVIRATMCGLRPSEGKRRASNDTSWSMMSPEEMNSVCEEKIKRDLSGRVETAVDLRSSLDFKSQRCSRALWGERGVSGSTL